MPSTVQVPDDFEVVPGRSPERARALLEAAREVGVDPVLVRSRPFSDEYHVPKAVADAFRANAHDDVEAHGPVAWAPNVVHPESATLSEGSIPENEGKAAEGEEPVTSEKEVTTTTTSGGDSTAEGSEGSPVAEGSEEPKKNASHEAWITFAESKGYDKSEDLSRTDLIEKYGTAE